MLSHTIGSILLQVVGAAKGNIRSLTTLSSTISHQLYNYKTNLFRPFTLLLYPRIRSRNSSVSVVTDYGLYGRGSISGRGKRFSLLHSAQTGSGAHLAPYTMRNVSFLRWVKRQGLESDHSPPFSAEVKNGGAIPPLPRTSSWLN
jgi:hypothetical protein